LNFHLKSGANNADDNYQDLKAKMSRSLKIKILLSHTYAFNGKAHWEVAVTISLTIGVNKQVRIRTAT